LKQEFNMLRPFSMLVGKWSLLLIIIFSAPDLLAQQVDKNYLLGQFDPERDSRFRKIPLEYSDGAGNGGYLRKETLDAFKKMYAAAKREGISLTIVSATRNFERQKKIWENKWNGKTLVEGKDLSQLKDSVEKAKIIMRFSAMPGTSRHHWGTDIDLNNLEDSYFETTEGKKVYQWLTENAGRFGFCQPYTSKITTHRSGYEEEKWHWSYTPLASKLLHVYEKKIGSDDLKNFTGAEIAKAVNVINVYVQGVNCR